MEYPYTNQLLYIKRSVINVLLRNSNSEPFKIPVNPEVLHVPQYPKLIKCPMDFGTIKSKLDKQIYQTANECKSDFLDVFRNCYIFNEPGSLYVDMALKLENLFKRKMADLPVPEHYVPESTFSTPKMSKVKKGKSLKVNSAIGVKPKLPINIGGATPVGQIMKPDSQCLSQKRNRNDSINLYGKDEPNLKKTKVGIDLKACKHIILNLVSKKYNEFNRYFLEPVDVEGLKLHDYYDIIKRPMDLGTVKKKLLECCYQTNDEFAEDVRLVFSNCYLYNPEGHEVHRCGKLLEAVFIKLYQSTVLNMKHTPVKPARVASHNYDDLQPLLHKIMKRQAEIDSLHLGIIKRSKEIRQSIDVINNTDFIKSFKASVNNSNNHKTIKSTANTFHHDLKIEKPCSPLPETIKPSVKSESKNDNIISKVSSNSTSVIQQRQLVEQPKSPKQIPQKQESVKENLNQYSENKRTIKPTYKSQINMNEETHQNPNLKKPQNHINNHMTSDHGVNSDDSIPSLMSQKKPTIDSQKSDIKKSTLLPPSTMTTNPTTITPIIATTTPSAITSTTNVTSSTASSSTITKNSEEFNARLKEIKTWISSLSPEMGMKVREFINKSEKCNVVSVNLLKLKPATINGLHKMMNEPPVKGVLMKENEPANLREFTIEDRMQLSQDLRQLGEKCSEKILNIYKKTEDVQSSDGECEIDFQTMKLVTLHSLREFADKCLQKKRDKQLIKGAGTSVGNSGAISDSDSSDSSDSDASDSNSDATSSSSDNDFFNNLPQSSEITKSTSSQINTVSNIQPKETPEVLQSFLELPVISSSSINNINSNNNITNSNVYHNQIEEVPSQSVPLNSEKMIVDSSTQGESHLSDSSDSDKDDDDEDEDDRLNSTPKRPNYSTFWNKSSNTDSRKAPINAPMTTKTKTSVPVPHPMYNNSARNQLNETLRQIAQDAQAHENVKKQEEELRLVRLKEEEELKKQQMLKMQALNESRKQMHHSEIQKKEENLNRLKEISINDRKQRNIDIPCVPEREDYHQILCDFEYNIDQDLIMKLVHLDARQIRL